MMKTVIGLFHTVPDAQYAIDALLLRKFDRSDISVIAGDGSSLEGAQDQAGSVTSGALNLLAALGAMSIPAVGPILAAGPLLAGAASTIGVSDPTGPEWVSRALTRIGAPGRDAEELSRAVEGGGVLVLVRAREAVSDSVSALLRDCGADVRACERPEAGVRRAS